MLNIKHTSLAGIGMMVLSVFVLSSCSLDPIDKTYSKHTSDDDFRRIMEISRVDSADKVLLAEYMVHHQLVGPHVLELHDTYADILDKAKKEKEEYEKEKRKKGKVNEIDIARSHEIEKIKNLKKVLFVDFVREENISSLDEENEIPKKGKKAAPPVNKNLISFDVMFKNISEKDTIRAFTGDLNFYDTFHAEIKKIRYTSFKKIPVGESVVQRFTLNLDEINNDNNLYSGLKKEDIKVEWLPERLIYVDDTVIE
ncbi:MAG TPA: hypothetical protein VNB90_06275 [Cytophagaceae bacterium]|nr:hypothetical protein [Cytophagaceae bacterium]